MFLSKFVYELIVYTWCKCMLIIKIGWIAGTLAFNDGKIVVLTLKESWRMSHKISTWHLIIYSVIAIDLYAFIWAICASFHAMHVALLIPARIVHAILVFNKSSVDMNCIIDFPLMFVIGFLLFLVQTWPNIIDHCISK